MQAPTPPRNPPGLATTPRNQGTTNRPAPGPGGTTRAPITPPIVNAPTSSTTRLYSGFPTLPTIAPIPPLNPINPLEPQPRPLPPPINGGRPDRRCPMITDPRMGSIHLPHESDCGRYYRCDAGLSFEMFCPSGLHWNSARDICDSPINANCRTGGSVNWNPSLPTPPPRNPNPGYDHPVIIPMAPRT